MKRIIRGGGNPLLNNKIYKVKLNNINNIDVVFSGIKFPPDSLKYKLKWKENIYE